MRALLAALALVGFGSPALENPGVPCVGFYFTTCSLIDLVPDQAPALAASPLPRQLAPPLLDGVD